MLISDADGPARRGLGPLLPSLVALVSVVMACGGDEDSLTEPPPADTTPPAVEIVFPRDSVDEFEEPLSNYDEDADALLDLRVTWNDAGSGVDPSTARIEILGQIAGSAGSGDDLSGLWTEVERSGDGLAYTETIEGLVRRVGSPRLVVSVEDSAGNRGADTLRLHLPYGDLHRSFPVNHEPGAPTGDLVVCEDDGRLYATRAFAVLVFDALSFEPIGVFPKVLAEPPARMLCIPGDPILYSTVRVERFDRTTLTWDSEIPGTLATDGIVHSRLDPDIIWGGEWGIGVPVQIDRSVPERVGGVGLPASSAPDEFTIAMAVLDGDRKIYYSRAREQGLVVGDPATGEQLAHIDLDLAGAGRGLTSNIVVSHDDRFVYAAVHSGVNTGLAEINTDTDEVVRFKSTFGGTGFDVALHPDGNLLWLTTQNVSDPAVQTPSLLIRRDVMNVVQLFPRPVPEGTETRWVQAATFHPSGKLLYQARDDDIDVYIIR